MSETEIQVYNRVKKAIEYAEENNVHLFVSNWDYVRANGDSAKLTTAQEIYWYVNGVIDGRKERCNGQ